MNKTITNLQRVLFPFLASSVLLISGCHKISEAKQTDRKIAENLAEKQEPESGIQQYHTKTQQDFINKLNQINTYTENKTAMYQDLITLCNEVTDYNSYELSKARYHVLPQFFIQLESFASENLPGFQTKYHPQYPDSKDPRELARNETLEASQLAISVIKYCEHKLSQLNKSHIY